MKRIKLIITLILLTGTILVAQDQKRLQQTQRIESEKIAFFTNKLNLSPEEARNFWPVYNEFSNLRSEVNKEKNEVLRNLNQNYLTLSDKDLEEGGDKVVSLTLKEAELTKEYHEQFKKVLPAGKVVRLYQVENQFRRILLEQLQNRRSGEGQSRTRQPVR